MKHLAILAALAFAGCSATNSLAPMPNITQPPVEANATGCNSGHVTSYVVGWKTLKNDHRHVFIPADPGYWNVSAIVVNDMSNGVYVRGGNPGNKRTYVPGHDETHSSKPVTVKLGKHSTVVVLRSIADPSSGVVKLKVQYCAS
jgi:hypothetical protein